MGQGFLESHTKSKATTVPATSSTCESHNRWQKGGIDVKEIPRMGQRGEWYLQLDRHWLYH